MYAVLSVDTVFSVVLLNEIKQNINIRWKTYKNCKKKYRNVALAPKWNKIDKFKLNSLIEMTKSHIEITKNCSIVKIYTEVYSKYW